MQQTKISVSVVQPVTSDCRASLPEQQVAVNSTSITVTSNNNRGTSLELGLSGGTTSLLMAQRKKPM